MKNKKIKVLLVTIGIFLLFLIVSVFITPFLNSENNNSQTKSVKTSETKETHHLENLEETKETHHLEDLEETSSAKTDNKNTVNKNADNESINESDVNDNENKKSKNNSILSKGNKNDNQAYFAYLDVAQGNAELIKCENKAVMIDTGKSSEYYNLRRQLLKLDVDKINTLVISHPDADHMQSAEYVIRDYKVKSIVMPKIKNDTLCYKRMIKAIKRYKVKVIKPVIGQKIRFSKNCVGNVLSVDASDADTNEASIVLRVTYKSRSFLYMGDATARVENNIIASGYIFKSDVYLLSHHGADTANGILFQKKALSAKYKIAIISVGKNGYGHPTKFALNRAEKFSDKLYRTDINGAVVIRTDGESLKTLFLDKYKENESKKTTNNENANTRKYTKKSTEKNSKSKNKNNSANSKNSTSSKSKKSKIKKNTWVYVTKTGKKYHKSGCICLRKSKIKMRLKAAKKMKYKACRLCH